jgi:hypothetical protein
MAHVLRLAIPAALIAVVVACNSSSTSRSPSPDYTGSCEALAKQCHGVKTPLGDECHDLGHAGDDAKCGPRKAECLAGCPDDAHGDGGHEDAASTDEDAGSDASADASDGAVDPCIAYCACMTTACSSVFTDQSACLAACAGFSATNVTCFAASCEDAKTAADPAHDCEHASGAVECH